MDNDKKVMSMLETLVTKVTTIETDLADTKATVTETSQRLDKLEEGQARLEADLAETKATVNETKERVILMESNNKRQFGVLHDGYRLLFDKLEPIPDAVEKLQEDVEVIKAVVTSHSEEIRIVKSL